MIFVDTSGFYAFVSQSDRWHIAAVEAFEAALHEQQQLVASSYVLAEIHGLIQHRFGLPVLRRFVDNVLACVHIEWIDRLTHDLAWALHQRVDKRSFTLVDASSAVLMDLRGIRSIIAFDPEFARLGYDVPPGLDPES